MHSNKRRIIFFLKNPVKFLINRRIGKKLYSDPNNYDNFKVWLRMMLIDKEYEIRDGYVTSKIAPLAWYMDLSISSSALVQFQ